MYIIKCEKIYFSEGLFINFAKQNLSKPLKKNKMEKKITIQELLFNRGLKKEDKIVLLRHKDNRKTKIIRGVAYNESLYDIYRYKPKLFLEYQAEQAEDKFKGVEYIVSFLGEEGTKSRFLGVYRIIETITNDSFSPFYYKMIEVDGFENLKERVIIDWGKGARSWCQGIHNEKEIIEITPGFADAFPGYPNVILKFYQLKEIINKGYPEWKRMLSAVNCIYAILDNKTGKIYVGSTYNRQGIWGRWEVYVKTNGHGNNVSLKEMVESDPKYADNFIFSILHILPINISAEEAIKEEELFKNKLGAISFGLCNN